VKLKPSRVDWLGDIPEHWIEKRAKFIFRDIDERSLTGAEELMSVSHITGVTPRSQKNVTMFKAESNVGHKICQAGDLVINTMWAWMSALGVAKQTGIVSPSYHVYRLKYSNFYLSEYVDQLLRTWAYTSEYRVRSTGIRPSRLRLYPDDFLTIPLIIPPLEEQKEIAVYIRSKCTEIDTAIARTEREIELMHEYRTRLISDVVTGKVDVRDVPIEDMPDPEESEEPDAPENFIDIQETRHADN
jgi:type I restriction enzyme S subunit